ncbi:hypothetical protein [Nocardioides convexus]|uniref:hypothetical protein n=1 Tax=Nocardioides convexus TaxID=2712224 RepID=UPI0024187DA3|nr:hypothetical protein [Nocardioides convexus]
MGDPDLDRYLQLLPRPGRRRAPAPGPRRQAAAHPVRKPGLLGPAGVQACSPPARLDQGYERFIERRLREEFGFVGTPIEIKVQPREKRGRR